MNDSIPRKGSREPAASAASRLPEIRCFLETCVDAPDAAGRAARFCGGIRSITPETCVAFVLHDQGETLVHAFVSAAWSVQERDAFVASALQSFMDLSGIQVRRSAAPAVMETFEAPKSVLTGPDAIEVPVMAGGRIRGLLYGRAGLGMDSRNEAEWFLAAECFGPVLLALDRLDEAAQVDPLTRIGNRRRLDQELERHLGLLKRYGVPFSLILIDVDRFKDINDRLGHTVGDQVLQALADVLRSQVREADSVCRHGGDEFSIVLPHTGECGARTLLRRLDATVKDLSLAPASPDLRVTLSAGCVTMHDAGSRHTPTDVLAQADRSLYASKTGVPSVES